MRTKAFHAFKTKFFYFDDDIDLVEVLRLGVLSGDLTDAQSKHALKHVDPLKHQHINRRKNSDGSRELLVNHLRQTVYSAYVKDIYEEVTNYLKTILQLAAENGFDAGRIIGEHSTKFDAKAVLLAGKWENIAKLISDSIFQALEAEKSTLKLLEKISNKLALGVDEGKIKKALPYLEVRHFLVHADGKIPADFKKDNPTIPVQKGYVRLDYQFVIAFREAIKELMHEFDQNVVNAKILKPEHTMP